MSKPIRIRIARAITLIGLLRESLLDSHQLREKPRLRWGSAASYGVIW